MVNYNPETVSTDYDECERLYFDEISFEVGAIVSVCIVFVLAILKVDRVLIISKASLEASGSTEWLLTPVFKSIK